MKPGDLVEIGSAYCKKTKKRGPYIAMVIEVHDASYSFTKPALTGYIWVNGKVQWTVLSDLKKVE